MAFNGQSGSVRFPEDRENQYREILQLAWPAILSQVSQTLFGLVDTLMIGKTGNVDFLAASALANNILSLPIVFLVGMSYASTPKLAAFFAVSDFDSCRKILTQSILNNIFWCFWVCVLLFAVTPQFVVPLSRPSKKLVYLYIMNNAKSQPEKAVRTLQEGSGQG